MSFARLRSELLAARDAREALLDEMLVDTAATVVFASTAVPGPQKNPPGSDAMLRWGLARLQGRIDACRLLSSGFDRLGPYAILSMEAEPRAVKRVCLAIENGHSATRLLDLDVYGPDAVRVGWIDTGEPPRPCLLCEQSEHWASTEKPSKYMASVTAIQVVSNGWRRRFSTSTQRA